ncbi:hypothetical protein TCSYLVIO_003885 [Trypanosoma cruzi]|nr:hypothetical protein TCSYLVIO_003885 [Trypanosoma cruzi]
MYCTHVSLLRLFIACRSHPIHPITSFFFPLFFPQGRALLLSKHPTSFIYLFLFFFSFFTGRTTHSSCPSFLPPHSSAACPRLIAPLTSPSNDNTHKKKEKRKKQTVDKMARRGSNAKCGRRGSGKTQRRRKEKNKKKIKRKQNEAKRRNKTHKHDAQTRTHTQKEKETNRKKKKLGCNHNKDQVSLLSTVPSASPKEWEEKPHRVKEETNNKQTAIRTLKKKKKRKQKNKQICYQHLHSFFPYFFFPSSPTPPPPLHIPKKRSKINSNASFPNPCHRCDTTRQMHQAESSQFIDTNANSCNQQINPQFTLQLKSCQ